MLGDGTKLASIPNKSPPSARLLDISRLISRTGRRPTGVDRVELAYLQHLLTCPEDFFAVARTTLGYVLLGRDGATQIAARLTGGCDWGQADRWSRLARGKSEAVLRAESDLRRFALDRARPMRLTNMLKRHVPSGVAYLNVGHSNLTERMLWAVRRGLGGRVTVMIHDTIPLDFPGWQRPGQPDRFRAMLRRVRSQADVVVYNSKQTLIKAESHMLAWGAPPFGLVAHLGVPTLVPDIQAVPAGLDLSRPFFVTVGTIEPRKGHDLLLDLWSEMDTTTAPGLLICGSRGWNNAAVFDRLDRLPPNGPIQELNGLSDGAIAALLIRSRGMLFPSRAEGFGLPPIEAAALGVPVVVNDLPVYRELLDQVPVYAGESDRYQWRDAIKSLATGHEPNLTQAPFSPPSWEAHFNTVLRFT